MFQSRVVNYGVVFIRLATGQTNKSCLKTHSHNPGPWLSAGTCFPRGRSRSCGPPGPAATPSALRRSPRCGSFGILRDEYYKTEYAVTQIMARF